MRPVYFLFLFLLIPTSYAQKRWHTDPSPLLLKELKDCATRNQPQARVGVSVYSIHQRRLEANWNDTNGVAYFKLIPAVDGDTLATSIWIGGMNDFAAIQKLADSLFAHIDIWFNKERPSIAIAAKLLSHSDAPSDFTDRLRYFSKVLQGTPYSLGPTGEGRYGATEPLPLIDLTRFDCVTYIESTIGLALSRQASDVVPAILPIRYHGDTLSYATRNHFFVGDWLGNNRPWFRILRLPGDTLVHKVLFKAKLLSANGLKPTSPDTAVDYAYLPYEKALQLANHWSLGKRFLGVAFVTHIEGLDVTHTGFIDSETGSPRLRQASQLKGKVVDMDFREYLESRRGKCAGVLLFEFLPPPARG